jgi:diphthamide biosynthesis protein 7
MELADTEFQGTGTRGEVHILASCMHAGARIVKLVWDGQEDWRFEVIAKFEEHKSMNYASDCQPGLDADGKRIFISTSFYDRLLCLWLF